MNLVTGIRIFVTHTPNKETIRIRDNPLLVNMIAGSEFQKRPVRDGFCCDNTGDHISDRNKSYCELTTQYWAWKNTKADYYGFCHYRRYFSFRPEADLPETRWGTVEYEYLTSKEKHQLGLDSDTMERVIRQYDCLVAKPVDVTRLGFSDVYDHYNKAEDLHIEDVDLLLSVIKDRHPKLYTTAEQYFRDKWFYPCNMFIMNRELFDTYSQMLFDVLEEFERRADMSNYSREGRRTIGHLGERMLGICYRYWKAQRRFRLGELQIALIHQAGAPVVSSEREPEEAGKKENGKEPAVDVVMAGNRKYLPVMYTCIQSLIDYCTADRQYRIYLFHTEIDEESQRLFCQRLKRDNVDLFFVNVGSQIADRGLHGKSYFSKETFYRFLILDVFRRRQKVVYLDCDMIIRRDIAELYDTDLGNNLLAAVRDADFCGQCSRRSTGMWDYARNQLGMKDPYLYFQAGVLVMNIPLFRQVTSVRQLLDMAEKENYRYLDQDILNIICQGRVRYLDMAWNVVFDCDHKRYREVIAHAPYDVLDAYEEARKEPYIIHYAGYVKPWTHPGQDFGDAFWEVARNTPYYEELLATFLGGVDSRQKKEQLALLRTLLMKVIKPDTALRRELGKIYWKMFGK